MLAMLTTVMAPAMRTYADNNPPDSTVVQPEAPVRRSQALKGVAPQETAPTLGIAAVGDILVNSGIDTVDANLGDGVCADQFGKCSLRAAIQTANANSDNNTIILPPGTYTLARAGALDDTAATGDLDILHDVTIIGSNNNPEGAPSATIVEAGTIPKGGIDRVFHVNPNGSGAANVTFKALTIRNGSAPGSSENGYGGGLSFEANGNTSSLTLYNVVVDNNKTAGQTGLAGGAGGGLDLYNFGASAATVLIEKSVISNNQTTTAHGGGISVSGIALTLRDSTVSGNVAIWSTGSSSGGGIFIQGASSSATIERSHFANNRSNDRGTGGGIYSSGAVIAAKSTTFNGNVATEYGGGIHVAGGNLTLTNVTMTANQADIHGGGMYVSSGTVALTNTIVYGNSSPGSDEIQGAVSGSYNMVGSDGNGGLTHGVNGNKVGTNPMLSALGDWGGWTQSYKLQPGSPAIEAGTNTGAPATDQRGFARVADSADTDATATADIGAYEVHPSISDIGNQTRAATVPLAVPFYVGDSAQGLSITATSSNQAVVPNGNLVITNGNTHNPTLTVTGTSIGTATITVTVSDLDARGQAWSEMDTFTMTVTAPPNAQPPTVGGATTTAEDTQSAAITLTPQAADTTVTHFKITAITNGKLYKSDGTTEITSGSFITKAEGAAGLKFTPTAQFYGTGSFAAQAAYDAAGTGLSSPATASISVTAVNDPPSFTKGPDQTVAEDAGPQTVAAWATGISAGPNEPAQTVSFIVTNDNSGLFSVQPAINPAGSLTYTPATDANGFATVTVRAQDTGGTSNGGSNQSAAQTFTITVNAVNDNPVTGADTDFGTSEDSGEILILTNLTANDKPGPVTATDEASQTLTITGVTAGSGGTVRINSGNIYFTPADDFHGNATFTYTVQDSGGATATGTVTVPVSPVADMPYVDNVMDIDEDTQSGAMTINVSPFDGAEVTHFQITGITGGKLYQSNGTTQISNGAYITVSQGLAGVKFTPDADLYSPDTAFSFTVAAATSASGSGMSDLNTVPLTVNPVNDAPTAANDTLADVAEDAAPVAIPFATLTGNDSKGPANESAQTLTVIAVSNPVGGTVAMAGTDVIFTPAADFNGTASFDYTVQDSGTAPNTDTATASFAVTAVNDAPVGADDTLSAVNEDSAPRTIAFADLLANDTPGPADENGQTLTITAVGSPVGGTAVIAGTNVIFTLDANFQGTAGFTYTVTDNGTTGGAADPRTDTASVSFTVNGTAETPTVSPAITAEDTKSTTGLVITPDPADGAAVTHFFITGITGGWLYKNDGVTLIFSGDAITAAEGAAGLKFMPIPDLNTPAGDTFTFLVQAALDGTGTGASPGLDVTITVEEVNDAPTGTDDNPPGAITEDYGTLTFNGTDLVANDSKGPANESGQTLTITAVDSVVGGSAIVVGGDVQFTAADNFNGTASFRYTVSDDGFTAGTPDFKTGTAIVTFTITPVPDAPVITDATTAEDTQSAAGLVVTRNALDGAEVTHFQVTAINGGRLFKQDGTELAFSDLITAAEGGAGLKFTPDPDANGSTFSVSLAAHDSVRNLTGPANTAAITVTEVNDAPAPVDDTLASIAEDSGDLFIPAADLTANDQPGPANENSQTLTVTSVTSVVGGTVTLDAVTQTITFTPAADFFGTAQFTYTVQDDGTTAGTADPLTGTATVTIPVGPVVDLPSVTDTSTAEETQSASGLVISKNAVDGAEVTGYLITGIAGGTLYLTDGTTPVMDGDYITFAQGAAGLRFTPAANLNTPAGDTFAFMVQASSDTGAGTSGPVTAAITVTEVNDAPVGGPDTLADVAEDSGPWSIAFADLTGNDSAGPWDEAGQSLTIVSVGSAVGGTVAISGTDVVFTPTPHFSGTASFEYTLEDDGTTDGAPDPLTAALATTVTFTVTPVNDAPVAADDVLTAVAEDSPPFDIAFADLLANDQPGPAGATDEGGQSLTITAVSGEVGGTASLDELNQTITFTLDPNFSGPASFTYTVEDNGTPALTHTAVVSFPVTPSAEAPAVTPATTAEETLSTSGLVITADPADGAGVTHFRITGITGGWLYQKDGVTEIHNGDMITAAEGADGLKFLPLADLNTPAGDTFMFIVQAALDAAGTGLSPGAPGSITVTEVNDAPTPADDDLTADAAYRVGEDSSAKTFLAAKLLANDVTGPGNESVQTLTITGASNAVGGTVAVVGGDVLFTPAANFYGTASFDYTTADNGTTAGTADAKSGSATVTFTVTPVADAPQITPATTAEDTRSTTGLVITRSAVDGAEVTHFEITGITGGRLYLSDGTTEITNGTFITEAQASAGLKFTPAAHTNTPAGGTTFGFTAKAALDGTGAQISTGTAATITVTEVNDDPTAVNDTLGAVLEESGLLTIPFATLTGNDLTGPANESGQTLTITQVTAVTGGSVEINGTTVRFVPSADFYGTATFTYTVEDDGTTAGTAAPKTSTATVSIPVTPVADAPSVTAAVTAEETQSTSGLVITRNAVDGAEVTHFLITGIAGGTLYQNNGSTVITDNSYITAAEAGAGLTFTPNADLNTPAGNTFTFTVKAALDGVGTGLSATGASASITVTEVNDAPTGSADTLSDVAEDSGPWTIPFTALTGNDSPGANEAGQALTVASVTSVAGGTVAITGTDVIFTPDTHFNGTASFTYKVQDNGTTNGTADGKTAAAATTVTFTVTEVNDAPVANDDPQPAVAEDSAPVIISIAGLLANDSTGPANEAGQTKTLTAAYGFTGGTITDNDGTNITFTLAPNFHGTAGFTYVVTDNGTTDGAAAALTGTAEVRFTVTPVADTPAISPTTTDEDTQSTTGLVISRNAVDGAEVTHFKITAITGGSVYLKDGTTMVPENGFITAAEGAAGLKFTPLPNRNSQVGQTFAFTVQAALDNAGAAISGGVQADITVREVNDPPVGADDTLVDPATFIEDTGPWIIPAATLLVNDNKGQPNEGGQTLTIIDADNAVGGTVAVTAEGDIRFTPSANHDDAASFRYTLRDNGKTGVADDFLTSTATVTFNISPVPDIPRIAGATTDEDTQTGPDLVIQPHVDDDAADVTDYIISNITGGTLYKKDGTLLAVNAVITAAEGAEGLRFTPAQDANRHNATFSIEVKAHDSTLNRTGLAGTAAITVKEVNDAPEGATDTLPTVLEDSATRTFPYATFLVNDKPGPDTATDEAGQTLTISAVAAGTGVSVERDTVAGTVKVTPLPNFHGTASFTYTVTDDGITDGAANPKTDTVTVTFEVTPVADTPDVSPATTDEETQSTSGLVITRNAVDSTEVTHFQITGITGGTLYQSNGTTVIADNSYITAAQGAAGLKFTPADHLNTPAGDSFTFTVKAALDNAGTGMSATGASASITVREVNDRPTGAGDTLSARAEDSGARTIPFTALTGNDDPGTNEGTQTLTVASVSDPVGGTVALSGTGPDVIFTPDADFNGTASFKYVVRDNGTTRGGADNLNALAATTVTFTITEVNDAPVGADDPLGTTAEDNPVPGLISIAELLANDSKGPANESGQTLSITNITDIVGLDVLNDGINITWTYNANFHGTAGFTYELTDNGTTDGADAKLSDTARVSITVTPVADTPSVTPASTLEEDQTTDGLKISRNVADGSEVTHFRISGITNGTLYHNDGTTSIGEGTYITYAEGAAGLKFTPVANRNNQAGDSFGFTVEAALDELGTGLSPATVAVITVNEKNDPPVGADDPLVDPATFIEDTGPWIIPAATLLGNDNKGQPNESGQTLTIIDADNAVGGTVAVTAEGDIRFTPSANHDDAASFRYTLRDNGKTGVADDFLTSTATVTFNISPVPDIPRIAGATTDEDTQTGPDLVIQPHVDDDAADVTDYIISNITGGTLYKKDGTLLAVNAVITAAEGAEGLRFTPAQDANRHNATFSIEVKAHDSTLNRTGLAGTAAITVKEVNDAPEGATDTLPTVLEDSATRTFPYATFLVNDKPGPDTATDEAGQTLTISAVAAGTGVSVERDTVAGTVKVTPLPDFNGTASFTYTVTDDGITDTAADPQSQTVTVTFTVTEVNDDPIGTDDTLPGEAEDTGPWTIPFATLLGNDQTGPVNEAGQTLTVSAVSTPTGGTVAIVGTDVIFTPDLNFNGTAGFTYTLEDDGTTAGAADRLSDTAAVTFTVTPVNDAPVAADKNLSTIVGSTARSSVSATDVENNPLTYAVVDGPAKGTVTMAADGTFEYTAPALGTFTFTYKANDGTADSNLATVTIAVQPVPIVPMVTISAPVTVTREESIVVSGMANPGYYVTVGGTTVQANGSGNWSATVTLVEGPNVITATNGPATASVTVVRDTKPPVITLTAPAERTDEESILLTATSEEGAKITIEGHEGATLTVSLKMGMNRFSATATDPAGNQATATVSVIRVGKVPAKVEIEPGKPGEVRMLNFKVEVPGEAVPQAITLEILSPSLETEAVKQAAGAAIVAVTGDADATGRDDGKPIHGLDDEATVTFTYDSAQVANPEKLRIYYFDPKLKVWVELGGAVDRKTNTITVQVAHFTTFAAMEPQAKAPVLNEPPAEVSEESLTVTGTYLPKAAVSLVINGAVQTTATTDAEGRFTLTGKLDEGRNWVYVKGTGTLASREMTVHYQPVGYTDIGGHWAEAQIKALAKRGVVSLYPEPLFLPDEKVTRLEFAVMVARVLGLAPVDEAPAFTDTDTMPAWALPEMTAAVKAGIIKGMPDGSFAPFNLVTRAEMAIMLTRALNYQGMDITPGDRAFTDADQIPTWAKDQVLTAARYGLITGYPDGSFQSGNSTTRAEAVTMLNRLLNLISRP
jgi:CSLREA domain-containing protein